MINLDEQFAVAKDLIAQRETLAKELIAKRDEIDAQLAALYSGENQPKRSYKKRSTPTNGAAAQSK